MSKSKQRSKPLEILTTKSKNKNKKKLSPVGKELLECYENNRQPVLLYGEDHDGCRKELICEVWLACGGTDAEEEYFYERTHITDKTWRRIDCGSWNGKQAHNELIRNISNIHHHDRYNANTLRSTGLVMPMGYLFLCKGLLFLDNLHCNSGDAEDSNHYRKIAKVIHDRKWGSHKYDDTGIPLQGGCTEQTKFDWLVAYTSVDNPQDFPKYFRERFKLISLDKVKKTKAKEEEITFDDVKLKISADNLGHALDEAFVSVNNGKKEKLDLASRFIEGLHSLADAVKKDKNNGWVFNKDLNKTCSDGPVKLKYELVRAFRKITGIGKRAKYIIETKHGSAKRLLIPGKNISFKSIS